MADASIKIQHPENGRKKAVSPKFFVASGIATGVAEITCTFKNSTGQDVPCRWSVLQQPRDSPQLPGGVSLWLITFEDIKPGNNYALTVTSRDGKVVSNTVTFSVEGDYAIGASYPGNNDIIPTTNFAAYGTTNEDYPINGMISIPGAGFALGSQSQGPTVTLNWVVQFPVLPTGNNATLHLTNSNLPASSQDVLNLTVK